LLIQPLLDIAQPPVYDLLQFLDLLCLWRVRSDLSRQPANATGGRREGYVQQNLRNGKLLFFIGHGKKEGVASFLNTSNPLGVKQETGEKGGFLHRKCITV